LNEINNDQLYQSDPVNVYKVTLEMYPEDSKNYNAWCQRTHKLPPNPKEGQEPESILMKKFFKVLNKEILKTNHPKSITFINDKGPKQIYKIVPRIDGKHKLEYAIKIVTKIFKHYQKSTLLRKQVTFVKKVLMLSALNSRLKTIRRTVQR